MGLNLQISVSIRKKLSEKHDVSEREIEQCFENLTSGLLEDDRVKHKTIPPTYWFIAYTNQNRRLNIVYIQSNDGLIHIKSAFEPNEIEVRIYEKFAN